MDTAVGGNTRRDPKITFRVSEGNPPVIGELHAVRLPLDLGRGTPRAASGILAGKQTGQRFPQGTTFSWLKSNTSTTCFGRGPIDPVG
jgi:hypothetical protein